MSKKVLLGSLGAAVVISALSLSAQAEVNPFAVEEVKGSFQVAGDDAKHAEGKCGEGKCGGDKDKEGKCGEGKCGAEKGKEGKCGEGKCGEKK